jgi:hypothetical protein
MKQIFKITTKQVLWTLSLVLMFALPVGTFAQTFTGSGNPQAVPAVGTGSFICPIAAQTESSANVALKGTVGADYSIRCLPFDGPRV